MRAVDDLTVALDDLRRGHLFRRVADQAGNEDVGIALQHDEVSRARLHQHIAIEPSQGTGTDEIVQHAIADDTRVEHGQARGARVRLQPLGQQIRPAVIRVRRRTESDGHRIAQRHDRARPSERADFHPGEEVVRLRGASGRPWVRR